MLLAQRMIWAEHYVRHTLHEGVLLLPKFGSLDGTVSDHKNYIGICCRKGGRCVELIHVFEVHNFWLDREMFL